MPGGGRHDRGNDVGGRHDVGSWLVDRATDRPGSEQELCGRSATVGCPRGDLRTDHTAHSAVNGRERRGLFHPRPRGTGPRINRGAARARGGRSVPPSPPGGTSTIATGSLPCATGTGSRDCPSSVPSPAVQRVRTATSTCSMSSVPELGSDGKSTISPTSCRRSSGDRWIWWLASPCTRMLVETVLGERDRSMQRDILLLSEMVDAAEQAQRLVAGLSAAEVGADRMRRESRPSGTSRCWGRRPLSCRVRPRHASRTFPGATRCGSATASCTLLVG